MISIYINIYISGMNYAIRSSFYLLLLIPDNIVSSDRVSVSSEVSQYAIYMLIYWVSILHPIKMDKS